MKQLFLIFILINLFNIDLKSRIAFDKESKQEKGLSKNLNIKEPDLNAKDEYFENIKIDKKQALDEINFWLRQVTEHALFMYLGLVDKSLKNRALDIYNKLSKLQANLKNFKTIEELNIILPVLKEERLLQTDIIQKQKAGKWVGWLYPSMIKHMLIEGDYFLDKLNGANYTVLDEKEFWDKEASDRINTIKQLTDPSAKKLIKEATSIADKYFEVSDKDKKKFEKNVIESIKAVNDFSKKYERNLGAHSLINKTLAEHESREGKRGQKILEELTAK